MSPARVSIPVLCLLASLTGCGGPSAVKPLDFASPEEPEMVEGLEILFDGHPLPPEQAAYKKLQKVKVSIKFKKGVVLRRIGSEVERVPLDDYYSPKLGSVRIDVCGTRDGKHDRFLYANASCRPKKPGPKWEGEVNLFMPEQPGDYALTLSFSKSLGERPSDDGLTVVEKYEYKAFFRRILRIEPGV